MRGILKLVVALAILGALAYVIVFVIGEQYTFDDVERGRFQVGPSVRGQGDARTFEVGLAIANRGDRSVEISEVGGIEGNVLPRVRVRMGRRPAPRPVKRLVPFEPFDLPAGRQREVRLRGRFLCSELGAGERIVIDALEVRYKVGFFDKEKSIALDRRVRVGRRRANC